MTTLTITAPKELSLARKRYPGVNWNSVMKDGILKRLSELETFEELKAKGKL